ARGIRILEVFSTNQPRLTLQEISESTGFNKTAVQRLTDTLMSLGYLGRNRRKEFYLEPRILTIGFSYLNGLELRQVGATHLRDFSLQIGQTVNLAVLDDLDVIFVFRNEIQGFYSFGLREGSRLPVYCTASGKVLLAALPDDDLTERLGRIRFESLTRFTITDSENLRADIEIVRDRGYSVADQEGVIGLYAVAVPVFNYEGQVVAAANLSMRAEESDLKKARQIIDALQQEGAWLSSRLGYGGFYPGAPFRSAHKRPDK
ncbi:MAG: IclR family transcriptional regulator C-terminal domain-containing protein, partial [Desulfatirhabdiaceae bacterium]